MTFMFLALMFFCVRVLCSVMMLRWSWCDGMWWKHSELYLSRLFSNRAELQESRSRVELTALKLWRPNWIPSAVSCQGHRAAGEGRVLCFLVSVMTALYSCQFCRNGGLRWSFMRTFILCVGARMARLWKKRSGPRKLHCLTVDDLVINPVAPFSRPANDHSTVKMKINTFICWWNVMTLRWAASKQRGIKGWVWEPAAVENAQISTRMATAVNDCQDK